MIYALTGVVNGVFLGSSLGIASIGAAVARTIFSTMLWGYDGFTELGLLPYQK